MSKRAIFEEVSQPSAVPEAPKRERPAARGAIAVWFWLLALMVLSMVEPIFI